MSRKILCLLIRKHIQKYLKFVVWLLVRLFGLNARKERCDWIYCHSPRLRLAPLVSALTKSKTIQNARAKFSDLYRHGKIKHFFI